jgi:hypothetical protein
MFVVFKDADLQGRQLGYANRIGGNHSVASLLKLRA